MQKTRNERLIISQKNAVLLLLLMILIMVGGVWAIVKIFGAPDKAYVRKHDPDERAALLLMTDPPTEATEPPTESYAYPAKDVNTVSLDSNEKIDCAYVMLTDVDNDRIIAVKGQEDERLYPASMTKLMTLIVAIEHIENMDDTFVMPEELLTDLYAQQASMAGFVAGEEVSMRDLLYAAALPSGADGTSGLALSLAGSEAKFVEWMNEKVQELGLKNTHFVNASGLHDPAHYSSMADLTVILEYCLQNETCKEIISTYQYKTASTEQHPDGIELTSTMFNRMYGNEVPDITILGGKTGYTDEAGQCLITYADTVDGHRYIVVTAKASSKWHNVYDTFKLYGIVTGTYSMDTTEESEVPVS